jgi:imidazolonepropionase-like amidohydrolase
MKRKTLLQTAALFVVVALAPINLSAVTGPAAGGAAGDVAPGGSGSAVIALVHGRIVRVSGPPIADGSVVMDHGKIAAVGANVAIPRGAQVINVHGLSVYPGLFDSNTELGISEISSVAGTMDVNELGDFNPAEYAGVAVYPSSALIGVTRVNGITTALTTERGGVISGRASIIDLAGWTTDQMIVRRDAALWINFPQGHSVDRAEAIRRFRAGLGPMSPEELQRQYRLRLDHLREYFQRAREYAAAAHDAADRNLEMQAMAPYVAGKQLVVLEADRADDIRMAVSFGVDEKLRFAIAGGHEAWECLDILKQHNVPVIYGSTSALPMSQNDPYDAPYSTPARLHEAGIPFAIATASTLDSRNLPYDAALAEAYGLPADEALKAITLYPAQILGLDAQLGSIDTGKRANLFVATGDPLDIRTEVRYLFIDGARISLENKNRQLYEEWQQRP